MSDKFYDDSGFCVHKERRTGEQKKQDKIRRKNKHALKVKKEKYKIDADYEAWGEWMK